MVDSPTTRKTFVVPDIKPLDLYDCTKAKICASVGWLLAKSYGSAGRFWFRLRACGVALFVRGRLKTTFLLFLTCLFRCVVKTLESCTLCVAQRFSAQRAEYERGAMHWMRFWLWHMPFVVTEWVVTFYMRFRETGLLPRPYHANPFIVFSGARLQWEIAVCFWSGFTGMAHEALMDGGLFP